MVKKVVDGVEAIIDATPRPSIYIIIGRRGSGKDVTGAALSDALHKITGKLVYSSIDPAKYELPKYYRRASGNKQPSDAILYLSDVHLMDLYARDWRDDESNSFIKWLSIVRHRGTDVVLTTQLTKLIDVQVIATLDALIIKEPSALAERLERPEVRDIIEDAAQHFTGSQKRRWEMAYVYTHDIQHKGFVVEGIKKPGWWTEEISKAFSEKPVRDRLAEVIRLR